MDYKQIIPIFIGITGGSGAGKSTLCNALKHKYPDKMQLIQLDDYFKPADQKPLSDVWKTYSESC